MKVLLLGGTGFVGRASIDRLARDAHYVRVISRRRERHRDLLVFPTVHVVDGDAHDARALERELRDMQADAIVNLVGVLNASAAGFDAAHVGVPRAMVTAARAVGVQRIVHMSAINAAADAPSEYLRSKARGEAVVEQSGLDWTIFRPNAIFGRHDSFLNRFARLLRLVPGPFPLACPQAKLQPVYVGDVVESFAYALSHRATTRQRYALCGPRTYALEELVRYVDELIGTRARIVPLNERLSRWQARLLQYVPGKPFTHDNYLSLTLPAVCDGEFPIPNIVPSSLESIAPAYLTAPPQRFDIA